MPNSKYQRSHNNSLKCKTWITRTTQKHNLNDTTNNKSNYKTIKFNQITNQFKWIIKVKDLQVIDLFNSLFKSTKTIKAETLLPFWTSRDSWEIHSWTLREYNKVLSKDLYNKKICCSTNKEDKTMACMRHKQLCFLLITAKFIHSSKIFFQNPNSILNNQWIQWDNNQIKISHIYTNSKLCLNKDSKISSNHNSKTNNGFNNLTKDLLLAQWDTPTKTTKTTRTSIWTNQPGVDNPLDNKCNMTTELQSTPWTQLQPHSSDHLLQDKADPWASPHRDKFSKINQASLTWMSQCLSTIHSFFTVSLWTLQWQVRKVWRKDRDLRDMLISQIKPP